jgi:hypothetical protein
MHGSSQTHNNGGPENHLYVRLHTCIHTLQKTPLEETTVVAFTDQALANKAAKKWGDAFRGKMIVLDAKQKKAKTSGGGGFGSKLAGPTSQPKSAAVRCCTFIVAMRSKSPEYVCFVASTYVDIRTITRITTYMSTYSYMCTDMYSQASVRVHTLAHALIHV